MTILRRRRISIPMAMLAVLVGCSSGGSKAIQVSSPGDLAAQIASYDLAVGPPGRFILGLLTADGRLIGLGTVGMRFCYLGTGQPSKNATCNEGPSSVGTFLPIPGDTLPTPLPPAPQIVDAAVARGVYATQVGFDRAGIWQVDVTATISGKSKHTTAPFNVAQHHAVPVVGDQALPTQNLTVTSKDAPPGAVDSRATSGPIPDAELHQTTIAAALQAHRPIVAVFATPVFCVSRFCGPVTDMVQQLAHDYADRASFVHVEIWRDFQKQVLNKAAADWLYRNGDLNEPWVFVIDANGKIVLRLDNVSTRDEIEPLLRQLPVIGPGG